MKTIILCVSIVSMLTATANAANIAWQTPTTISSVSDVNTLGTYFGSWAPGDANASSYPVNCVTFNGWNDLPGLSYVNIPYSYSSFGNPGTTNANYNALMQIAGYGSGTNVITVSWNGMTPGNSYLVELWINDDRNLGGTRWATLTGGASTSGNVYYGTTGTGPGQFITGTFVADASGAQTITLTPYGSGVIPDAQLNLIQVRDVTTPNVTWQTPANISGTSDVSRLGTYFGSWAPGDASASSYPVNGVTFNGWNDLPGIGYANIVNFYSGFGNPGTADANYNTILQTATYASDTNSIIIRWDGMTPGDTYLVELWINDGRNLGGTRWATLTGGASTSGNIYYGTTGTGPGQFIKGTFMANASGAQTITLTPYASGITPDAQFNFVQVRDITGTTTNTTAPTYTDTATNTTIVNGSLAIVFNKTTGLSYYSLGGMVYLTNFFSEFYENDNGTTYQSSNYTSHAFGGMSAFSDGFGSGTRFTFLNNKSGCPGICQNFYVYNGMPWFLMDVNVTNGSSISSRYMAPIKSSAKAVNLAGGANVLNVPFDNDQFISYNSKSVNGSDQSYEVLSVFNDSTRNGLVIGSISHDTWKTAIWWYGTGNNLDQLQVFGGASSAVTHDTQVHGAISGTSIWSPKIFVGYYPDWRDGMEQFGWANAIQNGAMSCSGGTPFGWNTYDALGSGITYSNVIANANLVASKLVNHGFANNSSPAYVNFDSFWDNLSQAQLASFVATVHTNGQKAGVYWTPFVFWGTVAQGSNWVMSGSSYNFSDAYLRTANGSPQSLDGAVALDPTHPGVTNMINSYIDYFKSLGFEFIKLDFLSHGSFEGQHYDPSVTTGIQAYNKGMACLRNRINGTMFISESIAPIFPAQYAHSRRIACDSSGSLSSTQYELNSLTYGWWQNRRIYKFIDMDLMNLLTSSTEVARTAVNAAAISGGLFLDSNNLIDNSQLSMATNLLWSSSINAIARKGKAFRAVDGNTGTNPSSAFVLNDNGTNYVALFNYTTGSATVSVNLARAGLSGTKSYTVKDLWTGSTTSATGTLSVTLSGSQSKLYLLQ
ncbi:MAG: hypothetical protein JWR19_2386 [Pedosphaera sp.]|nr:hypothetical protein [Pedosphaera sp.]